MVGRVEDVFLSIFIWATTQNQNCFFREKYLYLLPILIEYASIDVYTFFDLYLSLLGGIGWFIDVFRCNHPSLTMVKTFIFRKSETTTTSDWESHIFSKLWTCT
jgi:hypothetical protein